MRDFIAANDDQVLSASVEPGDAMGAMSLIDSKLTFNSARLFGDAVRVLCALGCSPERFAGIVNATATRVRNWMEGRDTPSTAEERRDILLAAIEVLRPGYGFI